MLNPTDLASPVVPDTDPNMEDSPPKRNPLKSFLSFKRSIQSENDSDLKADHDLESKVKVKFQEETSRNSFFVNSNPMCRTNESISTSVDIPTMKVISQFLSI